MPNTQGITKSTFLCLATDPTRTQNVTIGGKIDADVEIFTAGPGAVTIGDVTAERSISIFAGGNVLPDCGGGGSSVVSGEARTLMAGPTATIKTGNLTGAQVAVSLVATGNISAGTINLRQYTLGPNFNISPHSVIIYANAGGSSNAPCLMPGAEV